MTGRIFVSYRRDDSPGTAHRVCDELKGVFGSKRLFIDADIPAGVNFEEYLHEQLNKCVAFLAIIGPNWLNARDGYGHCRLHDPRDWVRIEIASALERKIRVIPVIIDKGLLPKVSELPSDLQPLASRQEFRLQNDRFDQDFAGLADELRGALAPDEVGAATRGNPLVVKQAVESIERKVRRLIEGRHRRGFWALVATLAAIAAVLVAVVLMAE
jgi:hypothetical protein